ncbi:MAG: TerC family protein [Polyangiaceae bacterium]|nr:TerC family protein [Polyangiaceae bacterium]
MTFGIETLGSLLALAALEIVLGIDNIVFIAIMVGRLPPEKRKVAYRLGLAAALVTRIGLLLTLSTIMNLTDPLFTIFGEGFSWRDMILVVGGLFLIVKSSQEIFGKVEAHEEGEHQAPKVQRLWLLVAQIMVIDIVFSLDSVITAVGMARELWVMVTAMVCAVAVMLVFAQRVGDFVTRHPSMQILALSFLLLIGVLLIADGCGQHVSKGYVYSAMGFSLLVELFNMRYRQKRRLAAREAGAPGSAPRPEPHK